VPSNDLVARLDQLERVGWSGDAFRHVAPRHDPLATTGARLRGGRWNPPGSFGALYLADDEATVAAEFRRLAVRQGRRVEDFLPRKLCTFRVRLDALLDLRPASALEAAALDEARIRSDDASACQAVGEAAHILGFEGIAAPSAAGPGTVLAVYLDNLKPDSTVELVSEMSWTAPPIVG
jgi:RES domain-containing protein